MDTERKSRSHHRKRREHRLQRLQIEASDTEGEKDGDEHSSSVGTRERSRSKPRKKKNSGGTYEEDIIDGFAIVSFQSIEDLEKYEAGKLTCKSVSSDKSNLRNCSKSPGKHKRNISKHVRKKDKKTPNSVWKPKKNTSAADNSDSSGETTDNLDASDLILNGPKKSTLSRRFSDVSTRSSSGAGYLCDSESGDERASDASLDIFTTKSVNHSILCDSKLLSTLPPVSSQGPTLTTTTSSVTLTTSQVTVTTATTTTCSVSLTTVTPVSTTSTTIPAVNSTSCNNSNSNIIINTNNNNYHKFHQHQPLPPPLHQQQHHHHQQQQQQHLQQQQQQSNFQKSNHKLHNSGPPTVPSSDKYSPHINNHHHHHHQQQQLRQQHHHHQLQQQQQQQQQQHQQQQQQHLKPKSFSHEKYDKCEKPDTKPSISAPSVIKRRPSTPTLSRASQSPQRARHAPPPLASVPLSLPSTSSQSSSCNSVINKDLRRGSPLLSRTPRRDELRDRDPYPVLPPSISVTKSFYPPGYPGHGGSTSSSAGLYSPLGQSPGLHSLHSTPPSHTAPFPGVGLPSLQQPVHPPTPQPHNMFAPPLPLGHPAGGLPAAPPAHIQPESPLSIANPDILREELNRRFLASQDRSPLLPQYMRADIHQHMHQHQHQHMHHHQLSFPGTPLPPPPPISTPSVVPSASPNLFEKQLPTNPFFRAAGSLPHRPGIAEPAPRVLPNGKDKPALAQHPRASIPSLPGYPPLLLNPAAPDALNSGIPGAFQPKQGLSSIHPSVGPLFLAGRDMDKAPHLIGAPAPPAPQTASAKKAGKWNAVHVRIAWEIYNHQQKQGDKGDSKSGGSEPLRPPSHLHGASSLQRPQELSASTASLMGSGRSVFEGSPHGLLPASSLVPPFARPSPYSVASSMGLGIGNGQVSTSREASSAGLASASQEWGLLHRPPASFPNHTWAKPEDKDTDRDLRDLSVERRREEDRDRERRMLEPDRQRFQSHEDVLRDRERFRESDLLSKSRSRSRSRSPMRNGHIDSLKSDRSFDRRSDDSNVLKIKEERRETLTREDELSERDRMLKNEYLQGGSLASLRTSEAYQMQMNLERARMLGPRAFLGHERVPPPHSLWNPFDKGPLDFQNHRMGMPSRELENQAREHLLGRLPIQGLQPGLQPPFPSYAAFEQERLREELIMRDERARRDYLERLPLYERDRLYYENKIPALRPTDHVALGHQFARNISPAHIKRSSPAVLAGAPPPLISGNPPVRGHGSPAVNKTKGVSPTDSVGESKRDSNSTSTDPDAHSR